MTTSKNESPSEPQEEQQTLPDYAAPDEALTYLTGIMRDETKGPQARVAAAAGICQYWAARELNGINESLARVVYVGTEPPQDVGKPPMN